MNLTKAIDCTIINGLPDAFVCHETVINDAGKPEDFIFIEVNPAFESMTGAKREIIAGKRLSEQLPEISALNLDWFDLYRGLSADGERITAEVYHEPLQRWYAVTAIRIHRDHYVTRFSDITRFKQVEENLVKKNNMLREIYDYSRKLMMVSKAEVFRYIAAKIKALTGASLVVLNTYDKEKATLVCRYTTLSDENEKVIARIIGRNIVGFTTPVSAERYKEITSLLTGSPGSLHEASFGEIPAPVGKIVEKLLDLRQFMSFAIMSDDHLEGTILLAFKEGANLPEAEELMAFSATTANALERRRVEEKLQLRTMELARTNETLLAEVAERKSIQERINYLAYHDNLTGLPNRLLLTERLNQAIMQASRTSKIVGVLFVDIDSFKLINDTMGHKKGDELLKAVAQKLTSTLRQSDTVARLGGAEFVVIVQNILEVGHVDQIAQKVCQIFEKPFSIGDQDYYLTTSIGIALYPVDGEDVDTLIKNADIAMGKAKEKGRNSFMYCTPLMKDKVVETMKLINSLYRAQDNKELLLYYQPQVNCKSGKIVGLEALLRWKHPEYGLIAPDMFISIAERTGLILPIGEWVLHTACAQNKSWQEAGLPRVRVAVNLSMYQLQSPGFIDQLSKILRDTGLDPAYLEIEITESIALKDAEHIIETLHSIKALGVGISIDDFGTKYSSLNYLKQLPVDRIKIATPFVQGINMSDKDEAITTAIIVLARKLGLSVIAEGVETRQQLDFLTRQGCDGIQGFYYYKPMPAGEIEKLLKNAQRGEGGRITPSPPESLGQL